MTTTAPDWARTAARRALLPSPATTLVTRLNPAATVPTALALMTALQLAALPSQNPVHNVVSLLVFAPGGGALFPLASALIAVATFAWSRQLARADRPGAARFAAAAGVSLVLLGVFPTDPHGAEVMSLAAHVHRYAALAMFIAIPAAALLSLRGPRTPVEAPRDRRSRRALGALVAICLASAAPALLPVFPGLLPDAGQWLVTACASVRGLVERIQLITMMAIVVIGLAREPQIGGLDPLSPTARNVTIEP